jgi:hypothetical protein
LKKEDNQVIYNEIARVEDEKYNSEIEEIRSCLIDLDKNEIADPIDLVRLKEHFTCPNISNIFIPTQGKKAGNMFLITHFEKVKEKRKIEEKNMIFFVTTILYSL